MDEYLKLVYYPESIQVRKVPTGTCNGRIKAPVEVEEFTEEDIGGTDYVKEYQLKELAKYEEASLTVAQTGAKSMVSGISGMHVYDSFDYDPQTRTETTNRVYNDYVFLKPTRDPLPIDSKKRAILYELQLNQIIIIQGDTGCGKTTQVPQFILDDYKERNEYCNIVVTQPRRLAAISVANHICEERGWEVGSIVGYQVGLDRKISQDTVLTYMTAGVLLQKIIMRKDLNEYTHIIIDEVHERTQEMDFLFVIIRRFLNTNSQGVKVILMSATFDTAKFAEYFKDVSADVDIPATTIDVNKKMIYDKSIHYIEELSNLGDVTQEISQDDPSIPKNIYDIFVKLILALKHVDASDDEIGHVLVFLPGIFEIEVAYNLLTEESNKGTVKFMLVPLHSSIPGHEQGRVFVRPSPGFRKIILSTNIAESSITVPDIVYVIDFCMTKTMVVHTATQYQTLKLCWASKTNCIQRAGRVGRVAPGRVYRLISRDFYEHFLPDDITPEMLRAPLERVVLMCKKLEMAELPESILALAMDPPDLTNIKMTIKNLKEAGGLLPTCRGVVMQADGDLTVLGNFMTNLPIDVKMAKMICLGYMFSCLEESVIMAAGCSLPNIFSTPFKDKLPAYTNKLMWADGSCSDLIAHLTLFQTYQNNRRTGIMKSVSEEKRWCSLNYLSHRSMKDWEILVEEIKARLDGLNIRAPVGPQHVVYTDAEKYMILKIIIAGAFYPNYFSRSCDRGQVDEKEVCKLIGNLDPNSTVYFTNMDVSQPGPLYEERIKNMMNPVSSDLSIYFDKGSKIYVQFKDTRKPVTTVVNGRHYVAYMPGKVHMDVYKAVRMRQLKFNTFFPIMPNTEAWKLAKQLKLATDKDGYYSLLDTPVKKSESVLPGLKNNTVLVAITHFIDAGHFYAQPACRSSQEHLEMISSLLNDKNRPLLMAKAENIEFGGLYAAKFSDDLFYRCRVLGKTPHGSSDIRINIIYVDYGNTERLPASNLFELPHKLLRTIPPQAMECVLTGVQPMVTFNPQGTWPDRATDYFRSLTEEAIVRAEVYSVINDIVSVVLWHRGAVKSINDMLVEKQFAEKHEEPYLSRENHKQRLQAMQRLEDVAGVDNSIVPRSYVSAALSVEAPRARDCRTQIELKGPFSPLEMKVFSMSNTIGNVVIEGNSINCVLLDNEPQDPHERLLVATHISKSQRSDTLLLRHTTLMQPTRGLPALISMIFAPQVLMKASTYGTSYASALCGLGADAANKPVYPEHDLKVVFDVDITEEDLVKINEIRFIMNRLIDIIRQYSESRATQPQNYHRQLKDNLMMLLKKTRESKEREFVRYFESWTENDFKGSRTAPSASYRNPQDIWPLHCGVDLIDKNDQHAKAQRHIDELRSYSRRYKDMPETVECMFCDIPSYTLEGLRTHIASAEHKANIERFISANDQ